MTSQYGRKVIMEVLGIETRVRAIIKEVLKVNEAVIKPDARFREDLGADSLDLVTLLMALEQEFGGSISDAEAAGMTTVGQAQALISSLNAPSVSKGSL
jgi:acyl carrier protein